MRKQFEFISFLSDYGFKITFGDEADTLFLRKSLQALIKSKVPILKVVFLSNEFQGVTKDSRGGLYDLICQDEKGQTFIVEMQFGSYRNFIQRSKFYAFQRMNTLVAKGNFYYNDMNRIYCIGFLGQDIFPSSKEYYHFGTLKNQHGEEMDNQITHVIVEIRKFDKKKSEISSDLEKLIFIMKNLNKFKKPEEFPAFVTEEWIESAIERLRIGGMTAEQRMHFNMMVAKEASLVEMHELQIEEAEEKIRKVLEAEKEKAVKKAEAAKKKAFKEAKAARQKAEAARQKAAEEISTAKKAAAREIEAAKQKNIQVALKLIIKGMPDNEIADITGLSLAQIKKLKK